MLEDSLLKINIPLILICKFHSFFFQNPCRLLVCKNWYVYFLRKFKEPSIATKLLKKNQVRECTLLSNLKTYYKAIIIKIIYWHKDRLIKHNCESNWFWDNCKSLCQKDYGEGETEGKGEELRISSHIIYKNINSKLLVI